MASKLRNLERRVALLVLPMLMLLREVEAVVVAAAAALERDHGLEHIELPVARRLPEGRDAVDVRGVLVDARVRQQQLDRNGAAIRARKVERRRAVAGAPAAVS